MVEMSVDREGIYNLFGIEGFDIAWYGVIIAAGIIIGVWLAILQARKAGYKAELIIDMMIWALPLAIICARLYYVITDYPTRPEAYQDFMDVIAIWEGGIAIYGAVIGAIIGAAIAMKINKFPLLRVLDFGAVGLIFGQAVGRWGNFMNQEAFGAAITDKAAQWFPNGVYITEKHQVYDVALNARVWCEEPWHQATFFYESMANFAVFFFLLWFAKNKKKYDGEIIALYFVGYGIARLIIEGMRTDSLWLIPGVIRISQLLSLILIILGVAYIVFRRVKKIPSREYTGKYQLGYKKEAK